MDKIKKLSFKKNFTWNFIGNVMFAFSQWIIIVLIAKVGSVNEVGYYALGLAITAPIQMLTNLQLRQVQATDAKGEYDFSDYYGLRILTSIFTVLLIFILLMTLDYGREKSLIIFLIGVIKILDSISDVMYGKFQIEERMDYIGISRIIKSFINIIVVGSTLYLFNNLAFSLAILISILCASIVLYDRYQLTKFIGKVYARFHFKTQKKIFVTTAPLGIMLMLGSLNTNLPRILLDKFQGEEILGYFASIAYLLIVGNMLISAIGQAAAPRLAKAFDMKNYNDFKKTVVILLVFGIIISTAGLLISYFLGSTLLEIIYGAEYAEYNNILLIIMVSSFFTFSSSFLGISLTAMRAFKIQPFLGLLWMSVTASSSIYLIPRYGVEGAAYSMVLGSIAQLTSMLITNICIFISKKRRVNDERA